MIRRLSLTARLTVLFGIVATGVLLGLGWIIAAGIEGHFAEEDTHQLEGKITLVRHLVENSPPDTTPPELEQQLREAFEDHPDLVVEILQENRRAPLVSSNIDFPLERLLQAEAPTIQTFEWQHGDRRFRGAVTRMSGTPPRIGPLIVAIGIDTELHERFVRAFNVTLGAYVLAAAVLCSLLGGWVVRRAMAPLKMMKSYAADITAERLDLRLPSGATVPELADLAEEINRMLNRLDGAFVRLYNFSSDLAHELRTPVSNLMTQTEVAISRDRSADEYRELLKSNLEELNRMARMISDMLLLSRADHGLVLTYSGPVVLEHELVDLFDYFEALAEERGIELALRGHGRVIGDRDLLRRVIVNLLSNALRYSPSGATVRVGIEQAEADVVLTVENPCAAISPEDLHRVFERFFRGSSTRGEADGSGAGLGLAIAKSIVLAHGGSISAESEYGTIRFVVRLPRNARAPGPRNAREPATRGVS